MEIVDDDEAQSPVPPTQEDIEETQYLRSIPGIRESIMAGMTAPDSEFTAELDW